MKLKKSQALPQVGDLYAKAGTPEMAWVVHRMLPDIDPGTPHVELLRVGDASTRVTISLSALVDPRMFRTIESNPSIERQLGEMGFGRRPAADEPPAAARDADRARADTAAEAAARVDTAPEAAAGAETDADDAADRAVAQAEDDEDDYGERVTRLYPSDRADDALESLERIDDMAYGGTSEAGPGEEAAPERSLHVATPEDTAEPVFDPDRAPPTAEAPERDPATGGADGEPDLWPDAAPAPVTTAPETEPVPARDAAKARDAWTDDLFAAETDDADDFDRLLAAADPDMGTWPARDAETGEEGVEADEDTPSEDPHER